ncbi:GAF domain-containing protein [Cryobacterium algoritolerans]|uniref:GAF domain-containing protein n=1 Tax=Cryobacterium algoritolerans TaxID=1259184 RepID=A0A4R8WPB6_9MICO|nr:GAF domain-containing protein [Cryobacterium algoritolerans]TFC12539.1 GAF domain-containing protein [Cryobacterium algoritolerans]
MGEVIRWAMAPVMRAWSTARTRDYDTLPRPRDAPQAHAAGVNSDRILLFGSGPAIGWGVLSHDLALPGSLARALSARTGRGSDVDVVPSPAITIRSARSEVAGLKLWRYDAIVLSLGTTDAVGLISPRVWSRELQAILGQLSRNTSRTTRIFVLGMQPIRSIAAYDTALGSLGATHARALNDLTGAVCAARPDAYFVPMPAGLARTPGRIRTAADYIAWAENLADSMKAPLDSEHHGDNRAESDHDGSPTGHPEWLGPDGVRAATECGLLDTDPEERFDRIVAVARRSYGTRSAAFTFLDGDRLWDKSNLGGAPNVYPLAGSVTAITVRSPGALVVPDTLLDPRTREHPLVVGEPRTRFYAGFPVEAESGERIGVLSVFDPSPRLPDEIDTVLLRELALLIQAELRRHPE